MGRKKKKKPNLEQGCGKYTPRKQEGLRSLLRDCLRLSRGGGAYRFNYWHIDLNAGCGWNEGNGCPGCLGSPIIFVEEAVGAKRRFCGWFCDLNPHAIFGLEERLRAIPFGEYGSCNPVFCDNEDVLPLFADAIRRAEPHPSNAVGSLYVDPNGDVAMPVEPIRRFGEEFPKIDLIININFGLIARYRGWWRDERFKDKPDPCCLAKDFGPRHWYIRNPPAGADAHERHTLVVGRTHEQPFESEGFYPLESSRGVDIASTLRRIDPAQKLLFSEAEE